MANINKQRAGFKFGQHSLKLIKEFSRVSWLDRQYRIVLVQTEAGEFYYSLRLYKWNKKGYFHFIKQELIDIPILRKIAHEMLKAYPPGVEGWS